MRKPMRTHLGSKQPYTSLRGLETLESRRMLAGVVINEIHFDPDQATEQVEFIELYNSDAEAIDLSGWRLDEAVDYSFPAGVTLGAGEYLVITQDSVDFQAKFGFAAFDQWETGDKLRNEGENIELIDDQGDLVDQVDYQLGAAWPTVGDNGNSIELINPELDNALPGNWASSSVQAGIPLIAENSTWSYRKGLTNNPPAGWSDTGFNFASDNIAWQSGQAGIGYGDGDDTTILSDMRNSYSSVYFRNDFSISGEVPDSLALRLYVDDGAIIYINGVEVTREHVSSGTKNYNSTSGESHEAEWEDIVLTGLNGLLALGTNTIAIHGLNVFEGSNDFSFNVELSLATGSSPTPGAQNNSFSTNAGPNLDNLTQSVLQPVSGEEVVISVEVTDPDGIQNVTLDYQLVDPGAYIRLTDAAYQTSWTTVAMHDDGLNGDAVAGDNVYTVTLPGSLQTHRRIVRYRVEATDDLGGVTEGPRTSDTQPNFAYFIYDGVPDYNGSLQPGSDPSVTYSGDVLDSIATYHLIANASDVQNSQYNSQYEGVLFNGTLVYDGVVYDHLDFRNRGNASTYQVGKNKWKIEFSTGHHFQGRDNYGNLYDEKVDEINILPGSNPWWKNDVSTDGTVLFESAAFKLYDLAGTPSPNTNYLQFRVIDAASETGGSQYAGDFWGLYVSIEQTDGHFLNQHDLADGSIYNMHGSVFGNTSQRTQGSDLPTDRSDLSAFLSGIDGGFETLQWWEENLNWDSYIAWNVINHAVNNSDIRVNENVNYYHNQEDGMWYIIPWDLDLSFEDGSHWGWFGGERENIQTLFDDHPTALLAYNNRLREITDLMFDNGDAALVVEELANVLTLDGTDESIVVANQAQWNYNPQKVKQGNWYDNFTSGALASEDFDGLTQYMQDYLNPGGFGYNLMVAKGDESNIPNTPIISYVGDPGFAIDGLVFQTSAFSDPQGPGTFANMKWRIAEVHNSSVANFDTDSAYIYEIEGTWESGEISTFDSQITIPGYAAEAGKTYRARVRVQDDTGRWSHWSDAVEFAGTPGTLVPELSITELHYHPNNPALSDENDQEFIEVLNTGTTAIDLSGVQITDFASTPYVFANGQTLAPGEYIVIARSPAVFESIYGTEINLAIGGFDGKLSNGGETITLLSAADVTIQSFTYDDATPWPEAADGDGPSLEIIDPLGDHSDSANWRASGADGGSPGAENLVSPQLAGDYDRNNVVDDLDYDLWVSQYGQSVAYPGLGSDGNEDGVIDAADYTVWRDHLGDTLLPPPVYDTLVLIIDPNTGEAKLVNDSSETIDLTGYSILSNGSSLLPSDGSWNSMEDQSFPGWEEASPSSASLTELNPLGALPLSAGNSINLGVLFNSLDLQEGVSLEFTLSTETVLQNGVTVFSSFSEEIPPPTYDTLVLAIDPSTGEGILLNDSSFTIDLAGYSILSDNSSLLPTNGSWNSLEDQSTTGWEEASPTAASLTELNALGSLSLGAGSSISLGILFDITDPQEGISLEFALPGGTTFQTGVAVFTAISSSSSALTASSTLLTETASIETVALETAPAEALRNETPSVEALQINNPKQDSLSAETTDAIFASIYAFAPTNQQATHSRATQANLHSVDLSSHHDDLMQLLSATDFNHNNQLKSLDKAFKDLASDSTKRANFENDFDENTTEAIIKLGTAIKPISNRA